MWGAAALLVAVGDAARSGDYAPNRFHVPLFGLAEPLWPETHDVLRYVAMAGALLAIGGVFARLGIAAVISIYGYLLSVDVLMFRNHVYLMCLLGGILLCSPQATRIHLPRLLRPRAVPEVERLAPRWPEQLLKAQILTVYFWAVVAKLNTGFLSGAVLGSDLAAALPESAAGALLQGPLLGVYPWVLAALGHAPAMRALSWLVVLSESFVVIGLCWPRWRRLAIIVGLVVHATIALTMNVFAFGLLMAGSYVLFRSSSRVVGQARQGLAAEMEPSPERVPG